MRALLAAGEVERLELLAAPTALGDGTLLPARGDRPLPVAAAAGASPAGP